MACSRLTFLTKSIPPFQFSIYFFFSLVEPDQRIDSPDVVPIFEIRVLDESGQGLFQNFFCSHLLISRSASPSLNLF